MSSLLKKPENNRKFWIILAVIGMSGIILIYFLCRNSSQPEEIQQSLSQQSSPVLESLQSSRSSRSSRSSSSTSELSKSVSSGSSIGFLEKS